jgi:hypothetical protein
MGILGGLSEAEARIAELEQELVAAEQARAEEARTATLLIEWKVRAEGAVRWAKACQERAEAAEQARDQLDAQIERLAHFIMQHVPGEPSQSQGAVDTAIRLLERATRLAVLEAATRAWDDPDHSLHPCDPDDCDVCAALGAAVAALDGPAVDR